MLGFLLARWCREEGVARVMGRTTLGLGYRRLDDITSQFSGGRYAGNAIRSPVRFSIGWPLLFGMSPGASRDAHEPHET